MEDKKEHIGIYDLKDRDGDDLWVEIEKNKITVRYWVKPYTISSAAYCVTGEAVRIREFY